MLHRYLQLADVSDLWRADGCLLPAHEIERRIWAAFWLGAFDDGQASSFGWIPEQGPQHGRFCSLFRKLLIGHGDEQVRFGKMTGVKVRIVSRDEMEEAILGRPDSAKRHQMRGISTRQTRKNIDHRFQNQLPSSTYSAPCAVDFVRLAREPWEFYERAKRLKGYIGDYVRNAAIRPAGLLQHCQRRRIPIPSFLYEYKPITDAAPIAANMIATADQPTTDSAAMAPAAEKLFPRKMPRSDIMREIDDLIATDPQHSQDAAVKRLAGKAPRAMVREVYDDRAGKRRPGRRPKAGLVTNQG